MPQHATPETSDRGFLSFPQITTKSGDIVRLGESSEASDPYIWFTLREHGKDGFTSAHLDADATYEVVYELLYLLQNHHIVTDTLRTDKCGCLRIEGEHTRLAHKQLLVDVPINVQYSPEQFVNYLLSLPTNQLVEVVSRMNDNAQIASQCFVQNHESRIRMLERKRCKNCGSENLKVDRYSNELQYTDVTVCLQCLHVDKESRNRGL